MCSTPHYRARPLRSQPMANYSSLPVDYPFKSSLVAQRDAILEERAQQRQQQAQQKNESAPQKSPAPMELEPAPNKLKTTIESRYQRLFAPIAALLKRRLIRYRLTTSVTHQG